MQAQARIRRWTDPSTLAAVAATAIMMTMTIGCGGKGSSRPPTVPELCTQMATQECQISASCGQTLTMTDCLAKFQLACMSFAATAERAPRVLTAGNVGRCINTTQNVFAKPAITPADFVTLTDDCNYVFQGNVDKLGSCTTKYDCAGSRICDKGKCADRVTKNRGEQCMDFGAVCNTGSYCATDTATGVLTCLAKADRGAVCDGSTPCLEAFRCSGGTCAPRLTTGTCASDDECDPSVPYCDPYAGQTCDQGLRFAPGSVSCMTFPGFGGGAAGTDGGGTTDSGPQNGDGAQTGG
jgi:hypothetical protein